MNADSTRNCRSSSANINRSSKRQRLDMSTSSVNFTMHDTRSQNQMELRYKNEIKVLRNRLSHTEAAAMQQRTIRKQIEELCEKEKNILGMQIQLEKETVEHLRGDLESAVLRVQEARDAQAAAEAELFRVQTALEEQIAELLIENTRLKEERIQSNSTHTSILSKSNGTYEVDDAEESNLMKINGILHDDSESREGSNSGTPRGRVLKVVVQRLSSKARVYETEGKTHNSKTETSAAQESPNDDGKSPKPVNMLKSKTQKAITTSRKSSFRKVSEPSEVTSSINKNKTPSNQESRKPKSRRHSVPKKNNSSKIKSQGVGGVRRRRTLSRASEEYDPLDTTLEDDLKDLPTDEYESAQDTVHVNSSGVHLSNGADVVHPNNDDPEPNADAEKSRDNSHYKSNGTPDRELSSDGIRIHGRKNYFVKTSSHRYHEIDWDQEFSHRPLHGFFCKKCMFRCSKRERMRDHVWNTHYEGSFLCCHCNPHFPLLWRDSAVRHMEKKHPELNTFKNE
ncbi:uncharacterized protein [Fopius arisanus]|uniref:Uncharacterized protein n=1 Tax=Fopius arisanus TaxID=64838 RepID=A0A9R1TLF4_9HYME|nr:PREDICTED: uncharacterized protein LOC105271530 [Fopius arisanus]